jgi:hypothetical protein
VSNVPTRQHPKRTRWHPSPATPCSVEACVRAAKARGLCNRHYEHWRRKGETVFVVPTDEERFWPKVDRSGECWEWMAAVHHAGYGAFAYGGRQGYAHRFSYELHHGPVPRGYHIDHLCRNPSCVRPDHLEAVTPRENSIRGAMARITHCPQGHPYSGDNLKIVSGARRCRICQRARQREAYQRNKRLAA